MLTPTTASTVVARASRRTTGSQQRFLLGGVGALLPAALYLLTLDFEAVAAKVTLWVVLGVLVKIQAQFLIGGFWGWLHTSEKNPVKLAELGMLAPAIIAGLLNGQTLKEGGPPSVSLAPVAHAETIESGPPKRFSLPEESGSEQFWRGFTGQMPARVWFVVVSSHPSLADAQSAATALEEQGLSTQGFKAEVFEPSGGFSAYAVVIGANLSLREAEDLRQRAIGAGFSIDTRVWRLEQ